MHLSRFENEHAVALSPHSIDGQQAFYGQPEPNTGPLTFKAFFTKAALSRERQSEEYHLRLRKLNAFGLTELTDKVTMSLLACMGYHTGKDGVSKERRRRILDRIYFNNLPREVNPSLLLQWSQRSPEERLHYMAETLSYVCLSRVNHIDPEAQISIRELKEDLEYLRKMYYYPSSKYGWPAIASDADRLIARTIMVKSNQEVRVSNLFEAVYLLTRKILTFS